MKTVIYIILISVISGQTLASDLLHCLGQEEYVLHKKKSTGPLYALNQYFINSVSSGPRLELIKSEYNKVCGKGLKKSPSLKFLERLIIKGNGIFSAPVTDNNLLRRYEINERERFVQNSYEQFFNYVGGIQKLSPSADCLEKNIRGLKEVYKQYRYGGSDLKKNWVKANKKEFKMIFKDLENINEILMRCKEEVKAKEEQK